MLLMSKFVTEDCTSLPRMKILKGCLVGCKDSRVTIPAHDRIISDRRTSVEERMEHYEGKNGCDTLSSGTITDLHLYNRYVYA